MMEETESKITALERQVEFLQKEKETVHASLTRD